MASLAQWLAYLESIHPTSIDMGLQRTRDVAKRLKFDWSSIKVITVGGTNGKGTTCKFIENLLLECGFSVATYRSPHLLDYRERVTLNGEMLGEHEYTDAMQAVEDARAEISLTYFEFGTLAAMVMMQSWQPDFVVLEVGLGGRLDATNIVDSDCSVITTIGLDHQAFLGNTLESVATEKAGIFRPQKPVVIGELSPPNPLLQISQSLQCNVSLINKDFHYDKQSDICWRWYSKQVTYDNLPLPRIPIQNASSAIAALHALQLPLSQLIVERACKNTFLPGRMQLLENNPDVIVDVAHNPQAAQALVTFLTHQYSESVGNFRLVVGMLSDKAIGETLACFSSLQPIWYLASTQGPRGVDASQIGDAINSNMATQTYANVLDALSAAKQDAAKTDCILVFGSFLTVADVLAYQHKFRHVSQGDRIV